MLKQACPEEILNLTLNLFQGKVQNDTFRVQKHDILVYFKTFSEIALFLLDKNGWVFY